jgi:hypothetical protein
MKPIINYIFLILLIAIASCKKDNYTEPSSTLTGRLVYKGEAIQLQYNQVPFEVYQPGWGKVGNLGTISPTFFKPEGEYSLLLFDGDYQFVVQNGQGPFIWKQTAAGKPDTMKINVKGDQTLDFEVEPYYMVRTPQFTKSNADTSVTANFKVEKIITDARGKNIQTVAVYVNKTMFVSPAENIAGTTLAGTAITDVNNISLKVKVPLMVPKQNYVYARIGVRIAGVEDWIFSPVQKIEF